MTLLTLELLGDGSAVAETTHTLDLPLSFKSATLRAVDLHAPGTQLAQSWTKAQTGDTQSVPRDVYSPLYVDISGRRGTVLQQPRRWHTPTHIDSGR